MIDEIEITKKLLQKLLELGYAESDLQTEVSTKYGRRIDLVVYESSRPKIAFEVKMPLDIFSSFASLEEEQLKYHPIVREVQSLAKEIEAPYFAVYDGNVIFWFGVDEDGRPKLLQSPVIAYSTGETRDEGLRFAHALYKLNDIGKSQFHLDDLLLCVGVSVLAWVLQKKGHTTLSEQLLSPKPNLALVDHLLSESDIFGHGFSKEFYSKALLVLEQITIPENKGREFVRILDDYLEFTFANKKTELIRLPVWISELMARLSLIEDSDVVLDLHTAFDDLITATHDINPKARLHSIAANTLFYIWTRIKRLLLNITNEQGRVYRVPSSFGLERLTNITVEYFTNFGIERPSIVFVAPPFGVRVSSKSFGESERSEDIYLKAAIDISKPDGRVVAILPDGFLQSRTHLRTRESIMKSAQLKAVFSLDQFMPGTSVKASILVLEKRLPQPEDKVVFARIHQSDIETSEQHSKSIHRGSRLQKILNFYKKFRINESITPRLKDVFSIEGIELTPSSWTLRSQVYQKKDIQPSEYPLIRLIEVAKLSKGSPLKVSKGIGTLPVIGPGAIRAFAIDQSKLDLTEENLLTSNPVISKEGLILINAVGPYRGQAAMVEQDTEGINISRNIIVVEPSRDKVLSEYLTLAINSNFVKQQLEELSTGSVILQLTIGKLRELLIPLPNIETQKRIIENVQNIRQEILSREKKIEDLQSELSELTKKLQSAIDVYQFDGGSND